MFLGVSRPQIAVCLCWTAMSRWSWIASSWAWGIVRTSVSRCQMIGNVSDGAAYLLACLLV